MRVHTHAAAAMAAVLLATPLTAQQTGQHTSLDRTKIPPASAPPTLHIPTWSEAMLANGARLVVSERHSLPLISLTVKFEGGADQFEPPHKHGLAKLAAATLSEGTATKSGDQLSDALRALGTTVRSTVGPEGGDIGMTVLSQNFGPALNLLADEMLHPTFPSDALDRSKARTLVALQQQRARTGYLAQSAFAHVVYGPDHPYGWVDDEIAISSLTRDDVVAFHKAYFQPARAIITVVGDIDLATAKRTLDAAFAEWSAGGAAASFSYPAPRPPNATTIYIVDKAGAAQSTFAIGLPGPDRKTPDYYAIEVMNTIVGTLFQSRLNHNIREEKGWSYGVFSFFAYGKGPGAFRAGGDVVTAKTDSALLEFLKELRGAQGGRPFTDDEMAQGKASLTQSLPESFSSVDATNGSISDLYVDGLPQDYYQQFTQHIQAVTSDDLVRVAKQYIDLQHLAIVIAGDRATIEAPLRALNVAPVVVLNANYESLATR